MVKEPEILCEKYCATCNWCSGGYCSVYKRPVEKTNRCWSHSHFMKVFREWQPLKNLATIMNAEKHYQKKHDEEYDRDAEKIRKLVKADIEREKQQKAS